MKEMFLFGGITLRKLYWEKSVINLYQKKKTDRVPNTTKYPMRRELKKREEIPTPFNAGKEQGADK